MRDGGVTLCFALSALISLCTRSMHGFFSNVDGWLPWWHYLPPSLPINTIWPSVSPRQCVSCKTSHVFESRRPAAAWGTNCLQRCVRRGQPCQHPVQKDLLRKARRRGDPDVHALAAGVGGATAATACVQAVDQLEAPAAVAGSVGGCGGGGGGMVSLGAGAPRPPRRHGDPPLPSPSLQPSPHSRAGAQRPPLSPRPPACVGERPTAGGSTAGVVLPASTLRACWSKVTPPVETTRPSTNPPDLARSHRLLSTS